MATDDNIGGYFLPTFRRGSRLGCWMISVSRRGRSYASIVIKRVRSIPPSDQASPPWSLLHHFHQHAIVILIFMEHACPPSKCKSDLISTYIKLPTSPWIGIEENRPTIWIVNTSVFDNTSSRNSPWYYGFALVTVYRRFDRFFREFRMARANDGSLLWMKFTASTLVNKSLIAIV